MSFEVFLEFWLLFIFFRLIVPFDVLHSLFLLKVLVKKHFIPIFPSISPLLNAENLSFVLEF